MTKARVLVVEDDECIQRMLKRYLEERGFVVHGELDAERVKQEIAAFAPDVILLDWRLPGVSGMELLRELRNDFAYSSIPVVMMSARSANLDLVEGLLTGADDYIVKPFNLADLEARIHSMLHRAEQHPI